MSTGGARPVESSGGDSSSAQNGGPDPQPLAALDRPAADQEILEAVTGGRHTEALRLCARQHGPTIGRLCMALVACQAEAEDLTQETLLAAHTSFAGYRGEGSLRAWLMAIARRQCARHLERRARQKSRLRLVEESKRGPETEELIVRRQRAELARTALESVRPSEREALVLRYVGELSYAELAQSLAIDEAAARKRVSRAIARLRTALATEEQRP